MRAKETLALAEERASARRTLMEAVWVARSAIASMESDASTYKIIAEASWMNEVDPACTGPKMVCAMNSEFLSKRVAELTARLEALGVAC